PRGSSTSTALVGEEPALSLLTPGVTAQSPVRGDHAMARNGKADGVSAVCRADGTRMRAELPCQLAVGAGLAGRNLAQRRPDTLLEWRAVRIHRDLVERVDIPGEVRAHLVA